MIKVDGLIGRHITVRANDFVHTPVRAWIRLVDLGTNSMLLEFDTPLEAAGVRYQYAVASPRLQRDSLDTLIKSGALGCGITWIPDTRYNPAIPFDLSWWRGGAAAIADVVL
jgi:hypothetical protein